MRKNTLTNLLTHSMMTPTERAMGRFMRAPDGHGSGGGDALTKADLEAAVEKATSALKESIDRLETKNKELIGENRKLKAAGEIKPEDLTAAEDRADKAEAELADLKKQVGTITKERDKAVKDLETESGFTQKLLIQDGLKAALIENGVKDADFIDTLSAKFARDAKVVADGETRKVMLGDKALADAIKEFAGSDSGKKFVAAAQNSGGGAPGGSGGSGGGKTVTRAEWDAMDHGARSTFSKDGGKVVDAAA